VSSDIIKRLIEAGTPPDLVADVAMELARAKAASEVLEQRRAKDRQRKRVPRNSTESEDSTENAEFHPIPSPNKVSPQTPLQTNPIPSPPYIPPASQKRGTRLAEDFEPPEDWIAWAMKRRGWSKQGATDECECFIRYWQAKPGREAMKLDWPKTWQNWVVNSRREAAKARGSPGMSMPC
jgi:hypothetical protein